MERGNSVFFFFFKSVIRFTYLLWECILLFLLLCSASEASCLSRATGCLSELSCGGRLSFYVCLCTCVCVFVCVCLSEGLGRQLAGAFFQRARLGEPPLQLWLMRSCCWPCRGQSTGTRWGWCLFVVRNRLGQGAPVVKHLNPHKHSSGSDFLLVKDTSSLLFFVFFFCAADRRTLSSVSAAAVVCFSPLFECEVL